MRLFLFIAVCLCLVSAPVDSGADQATSVEAFTRALTPAGTESPEPEAQSTSTRGLGDTKAVSRKPSATMHLTFALNSADLTDQSKAELDNLGKALEDARLRGFVYLLEGHTCDRGSPALNDELSRRRAESARNYLVAHFNLNDKQFEVAWYGETRPTVPNRDEASRQQNRRVIITNTMKSLDLSPASRQPVVVQVKYLRGEREGILSDGDALSSEDRYSVEFISMARLNVYVYQVDSTGQIFLLFPNPSYSAKDNPVPANVFHRLPEPGNWFRLDKNVGTEKVILLASEKPVVKPGAICARVAAGKPETGLLVMNTLSGARNRGLGEVVQDNPDAPNPPAIVPVDVAVSDIPSTLSEDLYVVQRHFQHR